MCKMGYFCFQLFSLSTGVRQEGVLSPILFCVYTDGVIQRLKSSKPGCYLGGYCMGCILYADDLVIISPSLCALQRMRFMY